MAGPAAAVGARAAAGAIGKSQLAAGALNLASGSGRGEDGGGGAGPKIAGALLATLLGFLLLVLTPFLLISGGVASSASCAPVSLGTSYDEGPDDPADMAPLEIATRIYVVGADLELERRLVIAALATGLVESGGGVSFVNVVGGDESSTGVFQQQSFLPWTARNRQNVAAAAHTFYEQAILLDTGQPAGDLAAAVQKPREDLAYKYGEAMAVAERWYARVEAALRGEPAGSAAASGGCSGGTVGGSADLSQAQTLYRPRSYKTLPAELMASGRAAQQVDARIWDNAVYILRTYDLRVTAAREGGHSTHGDGTALDMAPESSELAVWKETAERLARDLGWTAECAASGFIGTCPLVPAVTFVGYNGYDENHGDPAHTDIPHIHVSWASSCYGCGGGVLVEPREWVKAFVVGVDPEESTKPAGGRPGEGGSSKGGGRGRGR